jgi:hypothetical protein
MKEEGQDCDCGRWDIFMVISDTKIPTQCYYEPLIQYICVASL